MRILLTVCFLLLLSGFAFPKEKLQIDKEAWKRNTEKVNYTPEEKKPKDEPKKKEIKPTDLPDLSGFRYVAYIVVVVIILVLLILILKNLRPVQAIDPKRIEAKSIEEAEDNLPMVALTKIYEEAMEMGDLKRALRIQFLMVLQGLIDQRMVVWKKRKTNEQYLREISDATISGMFHSAVKMFDDVWYGETQLSVVQYNGLIVGLEQLKTAIDGGKEQ